MNNCGHNHNSNIKNIKAALFINITFTLIELAGGLLANSVAIISDAIHDLGDSIALSFSFFSEKYAHSKDVDKNYTYGLNRLPLLSAFLNSIVLLVGSVFILYNAIPRFYEPQNPHPGIMIVIAVVGFTANGIAMFRLKRSEGINSKVMGLHLLEDVLGWAAVLIGGIVIYFFNLPIIDPILSVAITVYILFNVFRNIRTSYQLFMQKSPEDINTTDIVERIKRFGEIESVTDFHFWSLEGTQHILTAHIKVKDSVDAAQIIELKKNLREEIHKLGDIHSTFEIEHSSEDCCDHC